MTLGIRPSSLLPIDKGWQYDLLLDAAILAEVAEGDPASLTDEISRKYQRYGLV